MLNQATNNFKQITCWSIATALILLLILAWGCSDSQQMITRPTVSETDDEMEQIFAAPKKKDKKFEDEKTVGPDGGQLKVKDSKKNKEQTKLKIPAGALDQAKHLKMTVTTDEKEKAQFHFEPHGTVFKKQVTIELSYASLKDVEAEDLILYDMNDDGEWEEHSKAKWEKNKKKCTFKTDHFSYYYYARR